MNDTTDTQVHFTVKNSIGHLVLDNPKRKNAITQAMAARIVEACDRITADESVGALVVSGTGSYFCSGADTRDLAASSADPATPEAVARTSAVYTAFVRVGSLPVPVIAAVRGGAVGAGLNLALAADLIVVDEQAVLDSGFLARGIHPGGGHLRLLGRSLGYQQAVAMGVLGQALSGRQAADAGLALKACPTDDVEAEAFALCGLAAKDPQLTRRIKQSASMELEEPGISWPAAVELERGVQMWSLGRKGREGWTAKPAKPEVG
ncbi:putative enoyl-CoA hydratase echA14 [Streptomyces pilosus]|uniref:enoyl-CoA hydratase/isomerase family protein n=1 Tax=Streptomyces pilosus TaxID=28893 RepID=UPI00167C0C9D|nr:enoyl-CoA hydratase-related protein [Streptomyces pilosus]GGV46170.1 putative enoyl-CoA hydratase echA14 [Streptomyces pilosus]